jgi:hypothetical protein
VLTAAFPARYGGRLSSVLDVKSLEETRRGAHGAAEISLLSSSLFSGGSLGPATVLERRRAADLRRQGRRVDSREQRFPVPLPGRAAPRPAPAAARRHARLTTYTGRICYTIRKIPTRSAIPGGTPSGFEPVDDDDDQITFDWGNRVVGLTLDQPLGARTTMSQRLAFTPFATHFDCRARSIYLAQSVSEMQLGGSITHARDRHVFTGGYEAASYRTSYREQLAVGVPATMTSTSRSARDRRRHDDAPAPGGCRRCSAKTSGS